MLRPTPGDPWGVEQHHWNTGAEENQQLNPGGPSNRQKKKKSLLGQAFDTSKELHMNGKESWYISALFILHQLNINARMNLDEMKSKLIKRSMELWQKQLHENAVIKEGRK